MITKKLFIIEDNCAACGKPVEPGYQICADCLAYIEERGRREMICVNDKTKKKKRKIFGAG